MEYCYPASIDEAVACLTRHAGGACVIAGGTDLLPDLREGKVAFSCLVDITRIPALGRIEVGDRWVTVGAAVTFSEIQEHPYLRRHVRALTDAASCVGAAAIQNAATWAGNVVQGLPAADGAIVAVALGAQAEIVGADGARWEPVEGLFEGPGCSAVDSRREVVTRLRFPRPGDRSGTAWRRVGRRPALVLPILNCAARVELERDTGGRVRREGTPARVADVAIALGPAAPRPFRARQAEAFLKGRPPRPENLERAGEIARSEAKPRSSVMRASKGYRLDMVPVLVSDALAAAVERAGGGSSPPLESG